MAKGYRKYNHFHCLKCGEAIFGSWKGKDIYPNRRFCSRQCYFGYKGRTNLEIKLANALNKLNLIYEEQKQIGKYVVDFFLKDKNIVIEADGNYWHTTKERWETRKTKDKILTNLGFTVLHLSQDNILSYKLENNLREFVNARN
jgi:very-short-patch-repair endonuclease